MLSDPLGPGELAEQPSEAGLREALGEDDDLAMEMQSEDFTGSPSEELRAWPLLRRITEFSVIEWRMDTGWVGDRPWAAIYMPDPVAWVRLRDSVLARLRAVLAALGERSSRASIAHIRARLYCYCPESKERWCVGSMRSSTETASK